MMLHWQSNQIHGEVYRPEAVGVEKLRVLLTAIVMDGGSVIIRMSVSC